MDYAPDLEIIGMVAVTLVLMWASVWLYNELARSVDRRRRRQRRKIERALVARMRCRQCGSRELVVERPEPTDRDLALEAVGRWIGRSRQGAA